MDENLRGNPILFTPKPKWYKKRWGILLMVGGLIIIFFLVYLSFLIYNEYQNIRLAQSNPGYSLEKFLQTRVTIDQNDKRLVTAGHSYLGNPEAKVKIVEFGDFQCPYSKDAYIVLRNLEEIYGDKIQIIYRDFPLSSIHADAELAAEAADCAQKQGKYWQYHDKLFISQNDLTATALANYASNLNLNITQFTGCLNNKQSAAAVQNDITDGVSLGVQGTPTFFVNGIMLAGNIKEDIFRSIIDYLLTK